VFLGRMLRIAAAVVLVACCAGTALRLDAQTAPPGERGAQAPAAVASPLAPLAEAASPPADERITPELEEAARQGSAGAQWKLGRVHADQGDHARALAIFRELAHSHVDVEADTANARILGDTYVRLADYHLTGIPGVLAPDPPAAQRMLEYAASYFRDPEAQYQLGRLLLNREGAERSPVQAARWLLAAARKDHRQAQALLGDLLIKGDGVPRQPGLGLFWLTLAADGEHPADDGIRQRYTAALAQTTAQEHALAFRHLEEWVRNQRQ
jgi:TPR repeat protein